MTGLFYTIPAGVCFADALAKGLLDRYADSPEILAGAVIFLPSQRGIRALKEAFIKHADGRLLLLPSLQALGEGLEEEPILQTQELPFASYLLTQKKVIGGGVRQLLLTRILLDYTQTQKKHLSHPEAFSLAVSMLELLDSLYSERIDVKNLMHMDLGQHAKAWQENQFYLHLLTDIWPEFLHKNNLIEPAPYRNAVLETLTQQWQTTPPDRLVIVAGSTGSMPASADFMRCVSRLPNGCVVLPGLDTAIPDSEQQFLRSDHPQYGLYQLLNHCETQAKDVILWHGTENLWLESHRLKARFMHEIMRPSDTAEAWFYMKNKIPAEKMPTVLENLHLIPAEHIYEEAMAIALIVRETLETPDKKVALVTPNRMLARRVTSILNGWHIATDDSAGQPLSDTPQGIFLKLLHQVLEQDFSPLSLLAFLKHPFVCMEMPMGHYKKNVRMLEEYLLRGLRPPSGIEGLFKHLEMKKNLYDKYQKNEAKTLEKEHIFQELQQILTHLEQVFIPLLHMPEIVSMHDFIQALYAFLHPVTTILSSDNEDASLETYNRFWQSDAGKQLDNLCQHFAENSDLLRPMPKTAIWTHLLEFTAKISLRNKTDQNIRFFIWGTPEARLQQADITILGGLTEGVWPIRPDTGIWLSRQMRQQIGLSPVERRIGLSAHDFVQAFCSQPVWVTYSQKADGCPLIASRWLIRMQNILTALYGRDFEGMYENPIEHLSKSPYLTWARKLFHAPHPLPPLVRPEPKPPVCVRPKSLSVTEIETWMKDPYEIYAKHILKLRKKNPLDENFSNKEKGSILHDILYDFMRERDISLEKLHLSIEEHLIHYQNYPAMIAFWRPRLYRLADEIITAEKKKINKHQVVALETLGETILTGNGWQFKLTARADRIDKTKDGYLIADYKTGSNKNYTWKKLLEGYLPQLPLQAMIIQSGGFQNVPAGYVYAGNYLVLSGKINDIYHDILLDSADDICFTDMIKFYQEKLSDWIDAFTHEDMPYRSKALNIAYQYQGDYDHLSRVLQWNA